MDRISGDFYYAGEVKLADVDLPASCVSNSHIDSSAAIAASKLQHQHPVHWQQPNTAATTETRVIYRCYGATGTILGVYAGSIAKAVGDSTVTVDVKKNGTTILTGVITLDNANTNRVAEAGTLSVTTLAAGDVLEVVITATVGTGTLPTGVFATVTVKEDAT